MGGFRRRMRRQAREAAKQLMRQGVAAQSIGRIVEDERVNRVLLRIVEEMEKRLEGKESGVSVRERLAAIKEIRALRGEQKQALEQAAEQTDQQLHEEEIEENAIEAGLAAAASPLGATHGSPATQGVATREPQTESEQRAAS